jgi:hypothetical protein
MTSLDVFQFEEIATTVSGPLKFVVSRAVYRSGEKSPLTFCMTRAGKVIAEMDEDEVRFFISQVMQAFAVEKDDEWTRLPTYAAVERDRQRIAARNAI